MWETISLIFILILGTFYAFIKWIETKRIFNIVKVLIITLLIIYLINRVLDFLKSGVPDSFLVIVNAIPFLIFVLLIEITVIYAMFQIKKRSLVNYLVPINNYFKSIRVYKLELIDVDEKAYPKLVKVETDEGIYSVEVSKGKVLNAVKI